MSLYFQVVNILRKAILKLLRLSNVRLQSPYKNRITAVQTANNKSIVAIIFVAKIFVMVI